MLASGSGHRQMCACTILKCMHIIHHLDGRELLFMLPMSDQEVFHLVEEKVYRVIGGMLAERLPDHRVRRRPQEQGLALHEAPLEAGDRRRADLRQAPLSHRHARARRHLPGHPVPDEAALPVQLRDPRAEHQLDLPLQAATAREQPHLADAPREMQAGADDELTPSDNGFSADNYRIIHFVVDMPVRLPPKHPRARAARARGRSARSSSSSASSRSSTARPRRRTSSARRPTQSTRSARRRPSCGASSWGPCAS